MAKAYTVSDGRLVLVLSPASEGGFTVTSPMDPELITEAETVPEAFVMVRDALRALTKSRTKLNRRILFARTAMARA
jgi:antitoxin HicB